MNGYNFTNEVRRVLTRAREASARLHHDYVGTEHILLGMIASKDQPSAKLLEGLSIDVDALRTTLESTAKAGTAGDRSGPDLPYTSRAKKCIELAMTEARERHDTYVGVEHLLAGVLREERGIAAQLLTDHGLTLDAVDAVMGQYDGVPTGELVAAAGSADRLFAVPTPRVGTLQKGLLLLGVILLVWSRIGAAEPGTWVLEVFPIFLGVPLLILTARRFPLTPLVYSLIFVHALILMLGGHYTYAKVPLGFWMQDVFHFARNHYDRIGHLAQGFVPAIIAREILIRRSVVRGRKWLFFLVTCICMTISVSYEFIEWFAAVTGGSSADAFLGTQGDVWDTQWDMFMALIGALTAQFTLSHFHDRQIQKLTRREY